jgi:outer membrane protein TolC
MAQTAIGYTSPIADYQPFVDEKVTSWKTANDQVGQIGGWRAYAKEAQNSASATPADLKTLDLGSLAHVSLPIRLAWLNAVAGKQMAAYAQQVYASSRTSAELAKRMYSVGNFTRLQQVHQQEAQAQAAVFLLNSSQEARHGRVALIRALGLNTAQGQALRVPDRLPDLPTTPVDESVLKRVVRVKEAPIHADDAPLQLGSAYANYRSAYDLSRLHRDEVLPLRKIIAEETLLRYNGMLIGVFELLAENREQSKAVMAAIAAQHAFWQADAVFQDLLRIQTLSTVE